MRHDAKEDVKPLEVLGSKEVFSLVMYPQVATVHSGLSFETYLFETSETRVMAFI